MLSIELGTLQVVVSLRIILITRGIINDRNMFILQATGLILVSKAGNYLEGAQINCLTRK